ncbi:MAG TPA: hypothetical protein VN634_09950 [Candidatus Limnocylindrales bacterium]|nr:hypothetical protein [Candidatus Limnocylindrales bacterium]
MNPFDIDECLRFGWDAVGRRPAYLVGVTVLVGVLSFVPQSMLRGLVSANPAIALLAEMVIFAASILLAVGTNAFYLKAHDDLATSRMSDLWHPQAFGPFLRVVLLFVAISIPFLIAVAVLAGIAGAIWENHSSIAVFLIFTAFSAFCAMLVFMTRFMFAPLLVVDRTIGAVDAMKESARLVDGRMGKFALLVLVVGMLNILGLLFFVVGILVTAPMSRLAWTHAYRLATAPEQTAA